MAQRQGREDSHRRGELGRRPLQERAASRGILEEPADLDTGPGHGWGGFRDARTTMVDRQPGALSGAVAAAAALHPRHRRNARQGLSAETQ